MDTPSSEGQVVSSLPKSEEPGHWGNPNPATSWQYDLGEVSLSFLVCKMGMMIPPQESKLLAQITEMAFDTTTC